MICRSIRSIAACAILVSTSATAQLVIYPAKGQSAAQQQKDESECYAWAKKQSGFDPAASPAVATPPPQPAAPSTTPTVGRSVARGAVAGAAIGAIGGNDVGHAAAKGAAVGGVAGVARQRGAQQQAAAQQQQASAQQQQSSAQQQQNFQRAYGACFEGKGYTVK